MPRSRTKLEPWIEQIILSYSTEPKEEKKRSQMKAHVVGVRQMSESQDWQPDGLKMLLFLSDGLVHIPAILTQDAWRTLQEQEDRECFSSLNNCTVYVYSYTLIFNMAPEQTKSQFYLMVGELITTSAGAAKDNTPCCTSLNSVREKICTTWRSLLAQNSVHSQVTQSEFNLSDLLGEWQQDWRQSLLEEVMELLRTPIKPPSPQPSSSTAPMHTFTGNRWAVDRIRYKGEETFNVPVSHLNIPDELSQTLHTSSDDSKTQSGLVPSSEDRLSHPSLSGTDGPVVALDVRQSDRPVSPERTFPAHERTLPDSLEEGLVRDVLLSGGTGGAGGAVASPWDMFAPAAELLRTSSASDESVNTEPTPFSESQSLLHPTPPPVMHTQFPLATSTQVSGVTQRSDEQSLPPYQKPGPSLSLPSSSGSSSSIVNLSTKPGMEQHRSRSTTTRHLPTTLRGNPMEVEQDGDVAEKRCKKAKMKSCVRTPEDATTWAEEDMLTSLSPPSWLLKTPRIGEGSCCKQMEVAAAAPARPSNVHADGTPFSYSYKLCGRISKDLSHFKLVLCVIFCACVTVCVCNCVCL
uniref:Shelterin complex subunit TPP1/Est3 domain-containing protein n=1 Tax=Esox lucius TaxID=8010 RepID=A0A3P8Y6Y2_ESOLU